MAQVLIPLADGFEEIEAVTIIDVLRRGGVEVVTASISDTLDVEGAHGLVVKADALFAEAEADDYEAVILPGGPGTANLMKSSALFERLRRQKEQGGLLCAICAAPTVLVAAQVLEPDQAVTCYPTCQMDLDRTWVNQPVVEHDNVITGQAPGSAMLFALVILHALTDKANTLKIARGMVTDVLG